jgi:hypothetical protein
MKLDLILENVKNKYTLGLLEEGESVSEIDLLKGKILINESLSTIRKILVEEGTITNVQNVLEEAWTNTLLEESAKGAAYDKYFKAELAKCKYDSVEAMPDEDKKKFFEKVDAGWNTSSEAGKDGEK